jgi:serine protease Do
MNRLGNWLKTGNFRYQALVATAAVFLFAGMLAASSFGTTRHAQAAAQYQGAVSGLPSFANLAEALGPSVVNIRVTKVQKTDGPDMPDLQNSPFGDMFKGFFGDMPQTPKEYKSSGAGSGVIINANGTILTNNHVVDGTTEIIVTLSDKQEYKARVLGRDPKTDLAVIKIDSKGPFKAAVLGDSDAARVGEWVLAIGNPFGLSNTVTSGIVSAKGRVIGAGPYDDFIQTDAPINPGNSGGPLFNMKGEVIGINTAIIPNGQGIGFAIPVSTAKALLPELSTKGTVTRGYLGVDIQNITEELVKSLNLKNDKGALVSEVVEGSPADKAGMKRGDVITLFNGKEIQDSHELASTVAATPLDKEVPLRVVRDGKEMTLRVKVSRLDSREPGNTPAEESSQGKWGLQLQDLTPELARQLGAKSEHGVVVAGVQPGSPADNVSVQRGDVILEVNRQPVKGVADMKEKIERSHTKDSLLLLIQRGGSNLYLVLKG